VSGSDCAPMAVDLSAIGRASVKPWVVDSGGDGASGGGAVEEKGNGKKQSFHGVDGSPQKGSSLTCVQCAVKIADHLDIGALTEHGVVSLIKGVTKFGVKQQDHHGDGGLFAAVAGDGVIADAVQVLGGNGHLLVCGGVAPVS